MLKIEKHAKGINITELKTSDFSGQYVIEPLYRGYGHTIGNALRRVLLSSIPGAAVKGVRIDGVLSEFSVMEGVKEAVTEIMLNVKEVVIKAETAGERKMTLSAKGPMYPLQEGVRLVVRKSTEKRRLCLGDLPSGMGREELLMVLRLVSDGVEGVTVKAAGPKEIGRAHV